MDDKKIQRQICVSTWQTAKNRKYRCVVQLKMSTLWDNVNINMAKVTSALFGTKYVETVRIKVSGRFYRQTAALFHVHDKVLLSISAPFPSDSCKLSDTKCVFL